MIPKRKRIAISLALVASIVTALPWLVSFGGWIGSNYLPLIFRRWPAGEIVISEVMYDPAGQEPDGEWFEFYNNGDRLLDLSGYKFGDEEVIGGAEGMFSFPPGATIESGMAIIVASYATTFQDKYGKPPDFELRESDPTVPNMVKYTAWASGIVRLDNTGDEVLVLDEENTVVDALSYGNSTFFFDPPVAKSEEEQSLARRPVYQDSDSAADWVVLVQPDPWVVDLSTPTPATSSATPSLTGTDTPSNTPSPTQSQTSTMSLTPTLTGTSSATLTQVHTVTTTSTQTSSSTPSQTSTSTRTSTSTATLTATMTSTLTPTSTRTQTPQPTPIEARLLISEVLYDPAGNEPAGEWFEIYNAGGSYSDLTGVKIGDEETASGTEGMVLFPEGAGLDSGEVIVIANRGIEFQSVYGTPPTYELVDTLPDVPDLVKYGDWASGSIYLNNDGDELLLLGADNSLLDSVSWGSSSWAFDPAVADVAEDHSIERLPAYQDSDSAVDWIDQVEPRPGTVDPPSVTPTPIPTGSATVTATLDLTPTRTATQSPTPHKGGLLVSEVMYDPAGDEPQNEWFELHNTGNVALDLTGYKVGDEETQGQGEGMYRFPDSTLVEVDEVITIANQAAPFLSVYGFNPDFELVESDPEVPNLEKYNAWASGSLALSNTGDDLLILDGMDQVVDAVSWGASVWAFDPAAPDVGEGHTLERYPAGVDTNTATDWLDQELPNPGVVRPGENWFISRLKMFFERIVRSINP